MTPPSDLDPIIHPAKRLQIMAILSRTTEVDFRYLRDELELRDADLSKQMRTLTEAGYVKTLKRGRGPKSSTWFRTTAAGTRAFAAHTAALRALIALDSELTADADAPVDDPASSTS